MPTDGIGGFGFARRSARRTILRVAACAAFVVARGAAAQEIAPAPAHGGGMSWGRESFVISEVLEVAPRATARSVDFDLLGWTGGAVHRVWAKADGGVPIDGGGWDGAFQLLYGRLVSPWWDAQVGVRVDRHAARTRAGVVAGLQGLAPGWFEVEPSLFLTTDGNAALDLTASYDLYVTQRVVVQPRLESSVWGRDDEATGIGRGLSRSSFGLRARVEIRREFAPYVGVVWDRAHGRTADVARAAGVATGERRLVTGLRLWW